MAEAKWLDGVANKGIEKICPRRHARQNEWQSAWNNEYLKTPYNKHCYDYISDYECIFNHPIHHWGNNDFQDDQERWRNLQAAKRQGTSVPITNLAHFTDLLSANAIVRVGGFIGGQKKIDEDKEHNDVTFKFSWWSPIFTDHDKERVRDTLGVALQPFLGEGDVLGNLKHQFATSDAFEPNPARYGNRFFQYGIEELCQSYGGQFDGEVQYKILGTFVYKQEVMHAVLVCNQANGAGRFAAYPNVLAEDVNNEAVITRDNEGNWVWKPQATATKIIRLKAHDPYPMYRRWEHVAFAFHIPEEVDMMMAGNPEDHHKTINSNGDTEEVP